MGITLIMVDQLTTPEVLVQGSDVTVRISMDCSYDDLFNLCRNQLSEDDLVELYRLWGDDYFPRTFVTKGSEIHITARN